MAGAGRCVSQPQDQRRDDHTALSTTTRSANLFGKIAEAESDLARREFLIGAPEDFELLEEHRDLSS
jgi:hypothetical protein